MKVIVQPATILDCLDLAPRLRESDVIELAAIGSKPVPALIESLRLSTLAWAVWYDGEVQAMLGVAPMNDGSGEGSPWLLASERITEFSIKFLRQSSVYLNQMHTQYPTLRNYVHALNVESFMWLRWCGFTFPRVVTLNGGTDLFIEFEKTSCAIQP